MKAQAPIAIFCYRRPEHLRNTLQSLMQCECFENSPIFVFGDGPRNESERASVEATREVARDLLGKQAQYYFSAANRGLSVSVISGVNEVLKSHDRVIVVEDDLVLDRWFLKFMNDALDIYATAENVFQVSGYMFDSPTLIHQNKAIFLPFTTSWGWATWRRAWQRFDAAARGWESLGVDAELRKRFNLGGAYDFATMLERQMNGQRDSWAIRWYWSVFKENGLVVFPPSSLVRNTGFDGSGTHGRGMLSRFGSQSGDLPVIYPEFPQKPVFDAALFDQVSKVLRWQNGGWGARCLGALRRLIRV